MTEQNYKFVFLPKYDGSFVQCFTDKFGEKHRYTLGSLEHNEIHNSSKKFNDVTEKLLQSDHPELYQFLESNIGYSLICELLTSDNVIKTKYDFENNKNGILKPLTFMNPNGLPTFGIIKHNYKWYFDKDNIEEIKEKAFLHMESNPQIFGYNPEGLVAYCYKHDAFSENDICFPIAKLKNPKYLITEKNAAERLYQLQLLKINGQLDDHTMDTTDIANIERFTEYLDKISNEFDKLDFLKIFLSQKQFTAEVEKLPLFFEIYTDALYELRKNADYLRK